MGSFNWDPRSFDINTELGIIIDSPALAEYHSRRYEKAALNGCYRPFLDEKERLRWRVKVGDSVTVADKEPDTGVWLRMKSWLSGLLPIRGQL